MKWTRWLNHKNHWYLQPEDGIRLEVDGEHYRITRNGKVECEGNGHSQRYAMDLCEAWYHRTKLAELQFEEVIG